MTCACCGKSLDMPGEVVATAPKTRAVLCEACAGRWVESKDAVLHHQLVALKQWPAAGSQFENFKVLSRRTA